jgi:thioredoxin reductase
MSKPRRLVPESNLNFEHSAILTIHIWLKENKLDEDFYGLIDSPVHWIFNHNDHITLVSSDANDLIDKPKEELFEIAAAELKKYTGIEKDEIKSYKVIKEKRSTFVPDNENLDRRPNTKTGIKNFFLAGDWVNTGLPSTIESAAKSGRMAAIEIMRE